MITIDHNTNKTQNFNIGNNFFIYGDFDKSMGKFIIPALHEVINTQKNQRNGTIKFFINSNGGVAYYLLDILTLIEDAKEKQIRIETHAYSATYSAASLLACAGTKEYRFIGPYTEHLCHLGSVGRHYVTNETEVVKIATREKSYFEFVKKAYKKYSSIPNFSEVIHDNCFYIRGQDIISYGLADKFIGS